MDNAAAKAAAIAEANSFIAKLNDAILFPLIYLLMGVALVFFIYGGAQYILGAGSDQAREQGKRNLMYGIIGFFVMGSAYAILSLRQEPLVSMMSLIVTLTRTPQAVTLPSLFRSKREGESV